LRVFFSLIVLKQKRILKISKTLVSHDDSTRRAILTGHASIIIDRTSKPTPNTRRAVARIRATHERKNTTTARKKQTRTKETKVTTFDRKKKKKVLREEVASSNESALAKVIANKKSVTSEEIVETIRNATFGELRMCFPLVFDGNVTSSNNKEWLKAVFTRKMVTDTAYEFVPRSKYSSTNRLKKRKEREEAMNSDINNATLKKNEYTTTSIPPPLPQDEDRIVVFRVEVGHQEQGEQHQRNDNARGYNVTGANTNDDYADEEAKQLSSFFTPTRRIPPFRRLRELDCKRMRKYKEMQKQINAKRRREKHTHACKER